MTTALALAAYLSLACGILAVLRRHGAWRLGLFAALNLIAFVGAMVFLNGMTRETCALYVITIFVQYLLLYWAERPAKRGHWLPILFPAALLVYCKLAHGMAIFGISYLSFRLSYMAVEVRDKVLPRPSLGEYIAFAFFPLLLAVGPITSATTFLATLHAPSRAITPLSRSCLRVVAGLVKFNIFAMLLFTLTPQVLLFDGYRHGRLDLVIGGIAYYGYLFCNFSGYTDIVIGLSGILGIAIDENFDRPYFARNLQDFWRRWHITLARYFRDVVYYPLLKILAKRLGRSHYDTATLVAILVTFVLTGLWHGISRSFFFYGLLHAVGLMAHYVYSSQLRMRLGPRMAAYNENVYIRVVATLLTFSYVCMTFLYFAYDKAMFVRIWAALNASNT